MEDAVNVLTDGSCILSCPKCAPRGDICVPEASETYGIIPIGSVMDWGSMICIIDGTNGVDEDAADDDDGVESNLLARSLKM
jgi:hypothetical protein